MNGKAAMFDAYHIMPQVKKPGRQEKKRKVPRIDFERTFRKESSLGVQIDNNQVEAFRRLSRHEQRMEYVLASLFAIISISAVLFFIMAF